MDVTSNGINNCIILFVYIIVGYWYRKQYRRYDESYNNTSYTDSNFIANTCLIDEKLKISNSIICNNNDTSYSVNTFCGNVGDSNIICINKTKVRTQIMHCNSSYDTHISTPINTSSPTAANNCNFNDNGTGYRIDICNENVINSQLYSYELNCNGIGIVVNESCYENTNKCFQCDFLDYQNKNIHDTCDTSNYMQLKIYENHCAIDTTEYNEQTTHDIIT